MTIRETAIAKLQQLPEPLLQGISDFIDRIAHKHQAQIANHLPEGDRSEAWAQWFKVADGLKIAPTTSASEYQQRLLSKDRQQRLNL